MSPLTIWIFIISSKFLSWLKAWVITTIAALHELNLAALYVTVCMFLQGQAGGFGTLKLCFILI